MLAPNLIFFLLYLRRIFYKQVVWPVQLDWRTFNSSGTGKTRSVRLKKSTIPSTVNRSLNVLGVGLGCVPGIRSYGLTDTEVKLSGDRGTFASQGMLCDSTDIITS